MGWRVIYIEDSDRMTLYLDNLKVTKMEQQEVLVPLKDIHSLIIDNYKLVISVQLISKCAENNINVVICGIDHNPRAILIPQSGHHQMALELRKQISWDSDKKKLVHQALIRMKINNQINVINRLGINHSGLAHMYSFYNSVEVGDITNREGLAAKVYFRILFGDKFQRFEDDVINAGLNYGYSVLRSMINKVIVSKGLIGALGIIHYGPANMFNLSDDIIEPFRPIVDEWVYSNLRLCEEFTKEHRHELIRITTRKISINQQKHTIFNGVVLLVESMINYFEGVSSDLAAPSLIVDDL